MRVCERCITVGQHATGSVGRYDVYRLNGTVGARRWYAQRNRSFADGPTPSRFRWSYWCLAGKCDGINCAEVMEFSSGNIFGHWKEPMDRILYENPINDLVADTVWVYFQ